ncbi:15510_t:CDS:10, partial [Funneliformis geosporum]
TLIQDTNTSRLPEISIANVNELHPINSGRFAIMSIVTSRTKSRSRTKEFISLLEKSTLGVIQPKTKRDLYHSAINNIGGAFVFSRDLKGHFSCVNAINNGEAHMLASGGDDKRVLIWNVCGDIEKTKPKKCLKGHTSNIFCTIFDSTNRHVLSCGNDKLIIYHDLEHESEFHVPDTFTGHKDAVQSVAFDPFNDHLFLSASQDGTVKLWDIRCKVDQCQGEIRSLANMTHAQYNPTVENQFITSDGVGDVVLRDTRMAFNSRDSLLTTFSEDYLMKYYTTLTRSSKNAKPDISSVSFNPSGNMLCATINRYYPTLYNVCDETPLCIFSSDYDSDTQTGYKNCCTYKQGHFGGPNGEYFLCGSDDFRVYIWKVPEIETMLKNPSLKNIDEINFINDDVKMSPFNNSTPQYVLDGHRSIVNSVIWHPHFPLIFSSGVEKIIKVHSAFPFSNKDYEPKVPQPPRPKFRQVTANHRSAYSSSPYDEPEENMEEDPLTLRFFDLMLVTEEHYDPYWGNDSSDSSDLSLFPTPILRRNADDDRSEIGVNGRENSENDDSSDDSSMCYDSSSDIEETSSRDNEYFEGSDTSESDNELMSLESDTDLEDHENQLLFVDHHDENGEEYEEGSVKNKKYIFNAITQDHMAYIAAKHM